MATANGRYDIAAVMAKIDAVVAENAELKRLLSERPVARPVTQLITKADQSKYKGAFFLNSPNKKPKFLYLEEAELIVSHIADIRKLVG